MIKTKIKKVLTTISFFIICIVSQGQDLHVSITGTATFDNANFSIGEAGEDFPSSIESGSTIFVSVVSNNFWDRRDNPNKKWKIYIHKTNFSWNRKLKLKIKRTGKGVKKSNKGNENPNIHGGNSFQRVTNNPTYFIEGKGQILQIPLNIKLSGSSIIMGAKNYETNIVLTVYDD